VAISEVPKAFRELAAKYCVLAQNHEVTENELNYRLANFTDRFKCGHRMAHVLDPDSLLNGTRQRSKLARNRGFYSCLITRIAPLQKKGVWQCLDKELTSIELAE
jgi:hypothetical protein